MLVEPFDGTVGGSMMAMIEETPAAEVIPAPEEKPQEFFERRKRPQRKRPDT
jgi:hypothetical protein